MPWKYQLPLAVLIVVALVGVPALLRDDGKADPGHGPSGRAPVDPPVLMVRSGRAVGPDWAERAARVPGVEQVVFVRRGQVFLRGAGVPAGYGVPVDTLVAEPALYAQMLPRPDASAVAALGDGEAILS